MMGLLGATCLVASGMIGAGVLVLPALMSVFGTWSIVGWLIATLMAYSIATIFGRLSQHFEGAGDPISYVSEAFGEEVGYAVAFGYFIALCFSGAVISLVLGEYILPLINLQIQPWIIGFSFLFTLFLLNLISSGSANAFLIVLTVLKVLFFSVIALMGATNIGSYQISFGHPSDMFKAASMAMFAFLGIEFAAASRSAIKNPEKNVMRATKLGLFFATIVFVGVHCAVLFTLPDPAASIKSVYDTANILFGDNKFISIAFGIVAVMSCLSTLNGMIIVQSSNVKGISSKAWWPESLGFTNQQGFAWKGALLFCSIVFCILYSNAADPSMLITIANSLIAIMYFSSCAVDVKEFGLGVYNLLAIVSSILILYNLTFQVFTWIAIIYIIGYSLKIIYAKKEKK